MRDILHPWCNEFCFPPTHASLRETALGHLGRVATSAVRLTRILDRQIERWGSQQAEPPTEAMAAARQVARKVVAELAASGIVDDAAFAETRARSMVRNGRSLSAVAAHLAARGVKADIVQGALPDDPETELTSALAVAKRRRIGPFRETAGPPDAEVRQREFTILARAGFPQSVAMRALRMDLGTAEELVLRLRRD